MRVPPCPALPPPLHPPLQGASGERSAERLVTEAGEGELGRLLREYGEERHWRGIARRWVGGLGAWGSCRHEGG